MPNWVSISLLHSAFAPESISIKQPFSFGMMVGMAVRRTPLRRLTTSDAPTTIAPVLPAETKASPCPSLSARIPTAIEQFS